MNVGGKKISTKEKRWYKDVGLGFKTPAEAINGTYIGEFIGGFRDVQRANVCCRQEVPLHW